MKIIVDRFLKEKGIDIKFDGIILSDVKFKESNYNFNFLVEPVFSDLKRKYTLKNLKMAPTLQKYRQFFWKFMDLDPTKHRPSGEALTRRLIKSHSFPKINPIVDSYNLASIESFLSLSAYDRSTFGDKLFLRYSKEGENFYAIGNQPIDLKGNELVLVDEKDEILSQYMYKDSQRSMVGFKSKYILIITNPVNHIEKSQQRLALSKTLDHLNFLKKENTIDFTISTESLTSIN